MSSSIRDAMKSGGPFPLFDPRQDLGLVIRRDKEAPDDTFRCVDLHRRRSVIVVLDADGTEPSTRRIDKSPADWRSSRSLHLR